MTNDLTFSTTTTTTTKTENETSNLIYSSFENNFNGIQKNFINQSNNSYFQNHSNKEQIQLQQKTQIQPIMEKNQSLPIQPQPQPQPQQFSALVNEFKSKENNFTSNSDRADRVSFITSVIVSLNYLLLIVIGTIEDWIDKWIYRKKRNLCPKGYAPLIEGWSDFYNRRLYHRIHDCWNRPVSSRPGAWIDVMDRVFEKDPTKWKEADDRYTLSMPGTTTRCLNLSSYNYLGFAENEKSCTTDVLKILKEYGVTMGSSRMELGKTPVHIELEKTVARYVGTEDAIVFGMGFATNSTTIPALVSEGDLVISDSLNHASIIVGAKCSGAKVVTFNHDDIEDLERKIRKEIVDNRNKPYKKIMIIVEGIYSMEGDITRLHEVVRIKNKYRCYLYVDEAHSIGALGKTGRGVCEYCGVDPKEIDILIGTFSKSFASVGGYVAGSKKLIRYLNDSAYGSIYANSMSPPCAQQIISATKVLMGEDGTDIGKRKLATLKENANMFRNRLAEMGFKILGSKDSPVVPVMLYNPGKMPAVSRACIERGLAVVVVGAPATKIDESRVRFCLSSAHSKEDLEEALKVFDEIGDLTLIKYCNKKKQQSFASLY